MGIVAWAVEHAPSTMSLGLGVELLRSCKQESGNNDLERGNNDLERTCPPIVLSFWKFEVYQARCYTVDMIRAFDS